MLYFQLLNTCSIKSMIICKQRLHMLLIKMVYFSCKVVLLSPKVCSRYIFDTKRCKAIKGLLRFVSKCSYHIDCSFLFKTLPSIIIFLQESTFFLTGMWRTTVLKQKVSDIKKDHIC